RAANGGWSETPPAQYKDYPLFTTKREMKEGIRYHVMRFNRSKSEDPVDPTDQEQFPRPVSLHRRDARALQFGRSIVKDEDDKPENPVDEAEAERQRLWKEQQEAQRAANQAQIAPVLKKDEPAKPTKLDKKGKTLSTYYPKHTEEAKKASGLRYEETLPWHLEDVDGKNVWVGSYVAALSEVNVALVISGGGFRMIPLERYYKFNHKRPQNIKSLEEAEKEIAKRETGADRWVLQDQKRLEEKQQLAETRKFLGGGAKVKMESDTSRAIPKAERRDDNDLDLSGDEFQDDDENPGFDADDEDTKDTKERLRRDHLGASIFDEVKEDEVEKEEKEEKREKLREKVQGKKLRKKLTKYDHNYNYASDSSSDNPFQSSSESDSEDEKDKDKDKEGGEDKKDEDKKAADQKDKLASGSNTKGNTTPSGKQKAPDLTKKVKSLKRPASPNASESSGNESTRKLKKIKKTLPGAAAGSANASRSGTPLPRRPGGATAASDGEGTANEGSDGGKPRPKKIKLVSGTATGTPAGSRAGSPAPQGQAGKAAGVATNDFAAARQAQAAGSPGPSASASAPAAKAVDAKPITGDEIVGLIVSNGGAISIQELLKRFKGRVGDKPGQMLKADWVKLVKNHAVYDKDKMLRPK
ncbi:Rap30/74 interaction domain-containing protein, partial [Coniochaeta sp. PMI_546]